MPVNVCASSVRNTLPLASGCWLLAACCHRPRQPPKTFRTITKKGRSTPVATMPNRFKRQRGKEICKTLEMNLVVLYLTWFATRFYNSCASTTASTFLFNRYSLLLYTAAVPSFAMPSITKYSGVLRKYIFLIAAVDAAPD